MSSRKSVMTFDAFYASIRSSFAMDNAHKLKVMEKKDKSLETRVRFILEDDVVKRAFVHLIKSFRWSEKKSISKETMKSTSTSSSHLVRDVRLVVDEVRGRSLVATKRLLPGDLVIMESPYVSVMYNEYNDTHCQTCFKRLQDKMESATSCPKCLKVKYCNEHCMSKDTLHWSECGVMSHSGLLPISLLAYRTVIKTGVESALETLSSLSSRTTLPLSEYVHRDNYSVVLAQTTHVESRACGELLRRISTSIYLTAHLHRVKMLELDVSTSNLIITDKLINVCCLLTLHLMACACNAYEISELCRAGDQMSSLQIGGAVYACISLTNHNCCPNTMRYNVGSTGVMRVSRLVEEGQELFDNYGHFFAIEPREQRLKHLSDQYHFQCQCQACRDNWPTLSDFRDRDYLQLKCKICSIKLKVDDFSSTNCSKCRRKGCEAILYLSDRVRMTLFNNNIATHAARSIREAVDNKQGSIKDNIGTKLRSEFTEALCWLQDWSDQPSVAWVMCQQVVNHTWSITGNFYCHNNDNESNGDMGKKKKKRNNKKKERNI